MAKEIHELQFTTGPILMGWVSWKIITIGVFSELKVITACNHFKKAP